MEQQNIIGTNIGRTVYCHFSFKRPKGKDYGLFAVAFYNDFEGKQLTAQATRRLPLWQDHQFITAIQAYEHALYSIHHWQGQMRQAGITNVMLVTDNSTLAGWIQDPKKNKKYTEYMNKAVEKYRAGAPKEITLSIGLCQVRDYEKSYKFCREDKVINNNTDIVRKTESGIKVIDIAASNIEYKTISQIEENNPNKPEIVGM